MEENNKEYLSKPLDSRMSFMPEIPPKQRGYKRAKNWLSSHKKLVLIATVMAAAIFIGIVLFMNLTNKNNNQTFTGAGADYAKQLPGLKSAVQDNPKDPNARKQYAVALYATKDLKEAKTQYEEASKLNDQDATVFNNLGNVYRDLGEIDNAIKAYRRSIELSPGGINAYVNLANIQLYSQNKPDDAIATYRQALEKLPNNEQIELLLGITYEQKGDIDNAKKTYQAILDRNPENAAAKANLARLNK